MKYLILLSSVLFSWNSFAHVCSALCTQYNNGTCQGVYAQELIRTVNVVGYSQNSSSEAFADMQARCKAVTPPDLNYSVDLKIYTHVQCGVDVIRSNSISATISNSCT